MGASSRRANATNLQINRETNQMNYQIAQEANALNRELFNAQNQWNLEQWERENEYNDPSAQVQRYLAAGINPLWAISGGNPGNASPLQSADAKPAEVAKMEAGHVIPDYDPYLGQHIGNIVTATRDAVNAFQNKEDLNIRKAAQITRSDLDRASAQEKRATTVGRDIENDWSLKTFDVRAREEQQKLHNLMQQEFNMHADTAEKQAKVLEIEEHKNLMRSQIFAVVESVRQRQEEIGISRYNAETGRMEADIAKGRLALEDEKFSQEIRQWNNQNLLQFMYKFGRTVTGNVKAGVELEGLGITGSAGFKEQSPADVQKAVSCGIEILERAASDPANSHKMKDAEEASRLLNLLLESEERKRIVPVDKLFNSTHSSIINPSDKWQ